MAEDIGRELRDTYRHFGTECIIQNNIIHLGIGVVEVTIPYGIEPMAMIYIDVNVLCYGMSNVYPWTFIYLMTCVQKANSVIKNHAIDST